MEEPEARPDNRPLAALVIDDSEADEDVDAEENDDRTNFLLLVLIIIFVWSLLCMSILHCLV